MSRIFISHNSADNKITEEIRLRLVAAGHTGVYVDFDPELGIPSGRDWEMELYRELRACQAMIVLCSKASIQSHWCFAEITHAKSVGKPVIPVRLDDCEIHSILTRLQIIDWTQDTEEAWKRLQRGLLGAGIDPRDSFAWDGTRPPYPGLLSFEPEDAAIFFGREQEIQEGLEILNLDRRSGGHRSLLVLGPSGSGKSSLVKAGLIPRLKRNQREWLVLDVIRPRGEPLRELQWTLQQAFKTIDPDRKSEIRIDDARGLCDMLDQLLRLSGNRDAKVLLVIDQAEELVSARDAGTEPEHDFTRLILESLEREDCPLHVVWTLRSDFLSEFQHNSWFRRLKSSNINLGPMDSEDLLEVIEGPAELAGIEFELGLAQKMISEARGRDALSLLAFTLRELYERFQSDGLLDTGEYEQLGGLNGALARKAKAAFDASELDSAGELELRRLFLSLVKLEQNGRYTRRPVMRDSVPAELDGAVERFVDNRLLVAGADDRGGTLEVAHEALFRAWNRLSNWLDQDRDYLLWNRRLDYAVQEWSEAGQARYLLMRGKSLVEANAHLREHHDEALNEQQQAFIKASRAAQQIRKISWSVASVSAVAILIAALFLGFMAHEEKNRVHATRVISLAASQDDPLLSALLILSLKEYKEPAYGVRVALETVQNNIPLDVMDQHTREVLSLACNPYDKQVVTASGDKTALIWDLDYPFEVKQLAGHQDSVNGAVFNSIGNRVATWSDDLSVRLWELDDEQPFKSRLVGCHADHVNSTQFSSDGRHLLTATDAGVIRIWDIRTRAGIDKTLVADCSVEQPGGGNFGLMVASLDTDDAAVLSASYSPDGEYVVAALDDGRALIWSAKNYRKLAVLKYHDRDVEHAEFSHKSNYLVTASDDGDAALWRLDGLAGVGEPENSEGPADLLQLGDPLMLTGHSEWITGIQFSPDDSRILTTSQDGNAILWNVAALFEGNQAAARVELSGHTEPLTHGEFSPDGRYVLTASDDNTVRVWDLERVTGGSQLDQFEEFAGHQDDVTDAVFCPDRHLIVSASYDTRVRLWDARGSSEPLLLARQPSSALDVKFSEKGNLVAAAFESQPARIWKENDNGEYVDLREVGIARSVDFSPAGNSSGDADVRYLLTVQDHPRYENGSLVNEWRVDGGGPQPFADTESYLSNALYSPDGESFVTTPDELEGFAQVWNKRGEPVRTLESHGEEIKHAEFDRSGTRVVTAAGLLARHGEWASAGPTIDLEGHDGWVEMAAFSPDGQEIATASIDRHVRVFQANGSSKPRSFPRHEGYVNSVTFGPLGQRLLAASQDGEARIWNKDGSGETIILKADDHGMNSAQFSPAGERIVTASEDGSVRIWRILWPDLLDYLDDSTRVCLSEEDRMDYLSEEEEVARERHQNCLEQKLETASNPKKNES
jgi:WD40 repeat protein